MAAADEFGSAAVFLLSGPKLDIQRPLDERPLPARLRPGRMPASGCPWEVLRFWIGVDLENLARIKAGIHLFKMPDEYRTNTTTLGAWVTQGITKAPDLVRAMEQVKECVAYLSSQLHRKGDLVGAARCALLLRHLFKDDISGTTHDPFLHQAINKVAGGAEQQDYLFRGVDSLNLLLDQKLTQGSAHEAESDKAR